MKLKTEVKELKENYASQSENISKLNKNNYDKYQIIKKLKKDLAHDPTESKEGGDENESFPNIKSSEKLEIVDKKPLIEHNKLKITLPSSFKIESKSPMIVKQPNFSITGHVKYPSNIQGNLLSGLNSDLKYYNDLVE